MKLIKLLLLATIVMISASEKAFSQTTDTSQTKSEVLVSSVKVKGITCSSDLKTIATNVEKLKGVNSFKTLKQGATATFEVNYDPKLVSKEEIYAAIENTGGCKNPDDRPYKVKGK